MKFAILTAMLSFVPPSFPDSESVPTISERASVKTIRWDSDKKMYRIVFYGKAGIYYVSEESLDCLRKSLNGRHKVYVSYRIKDLVIQSCR